MTDYSKEIKNLTSKEREEFFKKKKVHFHNEKDRLLSSDLESDKEMNRYSELIKSFRPDVKAKHPGTFSFYGSAEQYYKDAVYNILNYYPFDGTKEEVLKWYLESPQIDVALLRQFWPTSVGHVTFNYSEYVPFYAGPQSIPEAEFLGKYTKGESALRIGGEKGNTAEFWLKKEAFNAVSAPKETIFHIGTYPGKEDSSRSADFKVYLSASSGNPFHLTYKSGTVGATDLQLNTKTLTTSTIADSKWHHYALKITEENTKLIVKTYIDGQFDATTEHSMGSTMGSVDTYMAGAIAANISETTGSLSGSLDDFRIWKGARTEKQIAKFYDKKTYASDISKLNYSSRLGVHYSFNRPTVGIATKDSLVVDSSGNDVMGRIKNYSESCRDNTSAVDLSTVSKNTESPEPVLDYANPLVQSLSDELNKIGKSYDKNNSKTLNSYLPDWTKKESEDSQSNREFSLLLQILANEFDEIKMKLDSVRKLSTPEYSESFHLSDIQASGTADIKIYSECGDSIYFNCADSELDHDLIAGNEIDFSSKLLEDMGLELPENLLLFLATPEEESQSIVENQRLERSIFETRQLLYKALSNAYTFVGSRKGTESSYSALLNSIAMGDDVISTNIIGQNADLFITDTKANNVSRPMKSISFTNNRNATLFMSGTTGSDRTYLTADQEETEYTFEGTFIFPTKTSLEHSISLSSIFGLHQVTGTNGVMTTSSPDRASFQVFVEKESKKSSSAKFVLKSDAGIVSDLSTGLIYDVYNNQPWNIALRVIKESDNKFLPQNASTKFKVQLLGHSYVGSELVQEFKIEKAITQAQFQNFRQAHKTVFLGAHRTNTTGTVVNYSDIKVLDFNGWKAMLTDAELRLRAQNPERYGRSNNFESKNLQNNKTSARDLIFRVSPYAVTELDLESKLYLYDISNGSQDLREKYGDLIGSSYNFKSTAFTADLKNVIQPEFVSVMENTPIQNIYGKDGVQIKSSDFNKFDLDSRPEIKIMSFEKSMYRSISKEMINFISGVSSYNNLIGEPVNKYRKKYKLLDHLRGQFFEGVKSENQFERYVKYYRWIDKTIGEFLEQLVPASMRSNTGIENVVESHALERSKYDHKVAKIDTKDPDLSTNLLSINELLYDWEHGHYSPTEADHCLWHRDRAPRTGNRKDYQEVLTTVVTGSNHGSHFRNYALRNLVKPYKYTADKQLDLKVGSNPRANKIEGLHRIINEGKEITLKSTDVYEFKKCNDVLDPNEKKKFTAKVDVSGTSGYLDGDADLILPFSLFSSSAGIDFTDFQRGMMITNNHDDTATLQSPWIRENVGGMPHRRVKFNSLSKDANGKDKDRPEAYDIDNVMTAATATFTFGDTEFDDANNASITLTDAAGLSKTYVIRNDYGASSALEFNAGASVAAAAENFIILVNSANGHNGTIIAERSGGVITLTQATKGPYGNTVIATSNWNNITDVNAPSKFSGGTATLKVKANPRSQSMFHRDLGGARFYNIANIKTETSGSQTLTRGNYIKDYEIVQTMGRGINNSYLVDTEGAGLEGNYSPSSLMSGAVDFSTERSTPWSDSFNALTATATVKITATPILGEQIVITSLQGTQKTYTVANSEDLSARNFVKSTFKLTSLSLVACINSSHGHNGEIAASYDNATETVNLTQNTPGKAGNVPITHDLSNTTVSGFTNGRGVQGEEKYAPPSTARREHVFVSRFSPIGTTETQGAYGRDRVSGEFSIYSTVNYRNRMPREVYDSLSQERSEQFGIRQNSTTQASIHKTNRNLQRFTGSAETSKLDYATATFTFGDTEFDDTNNASITLINGSGLSKTYVIKNDYGASAATEFNAGANVAAAAENFILLVNSANGHNGTITATRDGAAITLTQAIGGQEGNTSITVSNWSSITDVDAPAAFRGGASRGSNANNFFVQHQLPQNDFGYSWITASADEDVYSFLNKNANHGHQNNFELKGALESSQTISFVESSQLVTNLDLVGLNSVVQKSLSTSENLLSSSASTPLNSLILNRQGAYGWPTWKQIRGGQHPVSRKLRRNNLFSISTRGSSVFPEPYPGNQFDLSLGTTVRHEGIIEDPRLVSNYKEVMISNRFRPVNFSIHLMSEDASVAQGALNEVSFMNSKNTQDLYQSSWYYDNFFDSIGVNVDGTRAKPEDLPTFSSKFTIQNDLSKLASTELSRKIKLNESPLYNNANLQKMNLMISRVESESDLSSILREVNYVEKIYPREVNTFTTDARNRSRFDFFGWTSNRASRSLILNGNLSYSSYYSVSSNGITNKLFPKITATNKQKEFISSYFDKVEFVDSNHIDSTTNVSVQGTHITSSKWVLDARQTFTALPTNITASYFTSGAAWMSTRDQGTRGEGILQNDYSIFALGINNLYGAPPISPLYNRRMPQSYQGNEYLSGESQWSTGINHAIGPFYDDYKDFSKETRIIGQQYSLVPEFTISRYTEDLLNSLSDNSNNLESEIENIGDFLQVTGATYHTSSAEFQIGSKFFKTYSSSDFLKYFADFDRNAQDNNFDLKPFRLNLRCKAVKRFLPYRGFYPAERTVQLSEIFSRCYMNEDSYTYEHVPNATNLISTSAQIKNLLEAKIHNSRAQANKLLFGPGVLYNSIKSGIAVDYPIFSSSNGTFDSNILNWSTQQDYVPLSDFSHISASSITCVSGSAVNSTVDSGIPRLTGSVSRRVTFDDFLEPHNLFGEKIYDNEPHPSASLYYGSSLHFRTLERPFTFGNLDTEFTKRYNAVVFNNTTASFYRSMQPYTAAANNFASETVDFFLEQGKLQTLMSDPVEPLLTANVPYTMRVYLFNNQVSTYDRHSAFGPPVHDGDIDFTTYSVTTYPVDAIAASGKIDFTDFVGIDAESALHDLEISIESTAGDKRTYKFNGGTAGTQALGSINFSYYAEALGADNTFDTTTVTMKSTSGSTVKTYVFTSTSSDGATGTVNSSSQVIVQTDGITKLSDTIAQLEAAIAHSNGHGGKILTSYNSSTEILSLTQSHVGSNSTAISGTGNIVAGKAEPSGFTGGTSGQEATGFFDGSTVLVAMNGQNILGIAQQLVLAIDHSNGHNGAIQASHSGNGDVFYITQTTAGAAGNKAASATGALSSRISGLTGGANATTAPNQFLTPSSATRTNSHGFLPYVPPFLDPQTFPFAEITFTPSATRTYSVPEIIEASSVTYNNGIPTTTNGSTNYQNSMQLSASLDLLGHTTLLSDNVSYSRLSQPNARGSLTEMVRDPEYDRARWVIQTKWESPVLDFTNSPTPALRLDNGALATVTGSPWKLRSQDNYYEEKAQSSIPYLTASTGMWHQSGSIPTVDQGYFLAVSGPPNESSTQGNLAKKLGFVKNTGEETASLAAFDPESIKKLGVIAKDKEVCEAIVAIPFYKSTDASDIEFFELNESELGLAGEVNKNARDRHVQLLHERSPQDHEILKKSYKEFYDNPSSPTGRFNIAYQLRMMDKFILPPHLDFVNNPRIKPHLQFFFQFKAKITQTQLKDLWENVYPDSDIGIFKAQHSNIRPTKEQVDNFLESSDIEFLSTYLDIEPMIDFKQIASSFKTPEDFVKNRVRWLIFKVKYRAMSSYDDLKLKSMSPAGIQSDVLQRNGITIRSDKLPSAAKLQFNWPYDFFSIVETAQIESKVDYYSKFAVDAQDTQGSSQLQSFERVDTSEETEEYTTYTSAYTSAPASGGAAGGQTSTQYYSLVGSTTASESESLVIRQLIKSDEVNSPSPANVFTFTVDTGYTMKTNSESIYVNGVLQAAGTSNDYTISGTTITFTDNIENSSSIYMTYLKQSNT